MISNVSPGRSPRCDAVTSVPMLAPPLWVVPPLSCSTNSSHDPMRPDTRYVPAPSMVARRATWSTFGPPQRYVGSALRKNAGWAGSLNPVA